MTDLAVKLTTEKAPAAWGENAILSFEGNTATIHLSELDPLRTIRQAARKLDELSLPGVKLSGSWEKEQQWQFALSFSRARNAARIAWADTPDAEILATQYSTLCFTRELVNDTPEDLSPETLATRAAKWLQSLAPDAVSYRMIVGDALQQQGWTGIYNVGRGSERPPVMLELDYNPGGDPNAPVDFALVGKGITFDSGGYSIKPSEGMLTMKCDMGGAATVTGALGLAIQQKLNKRVTLILCCAENLISGHAYKLGDVLTYKNGVSVEIVNTDAEGRLVLADGLLRASELNARVIVDAATLTGAAMVALGPDYHAVFSMDKALQQNLLGCAEQENELFWPLPLAPFHKNRCPSPFADTANSRPMKGGGAGGASNAAGFLARFVNESGQGWIHLDLAAAYTANATGEMPAGATGLGIKTIARLLRDN